MGSAKQKAVSDPNGDIIQNQNCLVAVLCFWHGKLSTPFYHDSIRGGSQTFICTISNKEY
jgi:hypothetical protein